MTTIMEINRETALRLWTKEFGASQKAIDFAGREIAKAAYSDRSSKYGWNLDHILPVSRGGKTADYNLVCCHIQTNDEKADKFPCFTANGNSFEIQKRQNHYEIIDKKPKVEKNSPHEMAVNFYDAAQGLRFFNHHNKTHNYHVGYVKIEVTPLQDQEDFSDFIDGYAAFLEELFDTRCEPSWGQGSWHRDKCFFAIVVTKLHSYDELRDKCVLLNTYSMYFMEHEFCEFIKIIAGANENDSVKDSQLTWGNFHEQMVFNSFLFNNTIAHTEITEQERYIDTALMETFAIYNCVFGKLLKDLEKQ